MGRKTSLPKDAKIGDTFSKIVKIKGSNRKMVWVRTKNYGRNENLKWKIKSNKKV